MTIISLKKNVIFFNFNYDSIGQTCVDRVTEIIAVPAGPWGRPLVSALFVSCCIYFCLSCAFKKLYWIWDWTAICTRPCSIGRCVRPNVCNCDGGGNGAAGASACQGPAGGSLIGINNITILLAKFRYGNNNRLNRDCTDGGSNGGGGGSSCPTLCQNGGSCVGRKCVCRPGYSGDSCEDG